MEPLDPRRHDHAFALQCCHAHRASISGARAAMKLRDLGEDKLLDQLLLHLPLGQTVASGAGDDCAVVENRAGRNLLVLKTDCIVESVHFFSGANALDVGWKAMMRPLSDFAATSAVPQFALVTEKTRCVSRRGGKAGDDLFVTGRLGCATKRRHLEFVPRIAESRWLTKNFSIHAMMDLSDGLGVDLPRLARASKVGFKIELENLPLSRGAKIDDAISEGEDYELLFAISPRERSRLEREWRKRFPKLPLTRIGQLHRTSNINHQPSLGGYVHFQQPG
ncbi:MAG: hypothetical protein DME85_08220 [Verrucomicrobia bacterium]|nr:MAG: hypothetical protein DME85_08220 [Verrucomicrobiota bacterium]